MKATVRGSENHRSSQTRQIVEQVLLVRLIKFAKLNFSLQIGPAAQRYVLLQV